MVLRTKPRNYSDDFEAQITKPELLVLRLKPKKPIATGFEAKPKKIVQVVLRSNH
jgi:hypothetical protein